MELISILKEAENMYNEIFCCNGKCSCFDQCSNKMPFDSDASIICNRSLKLGSLYGKKAKILFVGKESVTPSWSSSPVEPESFLTQRNQHYRRTKFILSSLLNDCDDNTVSSFDGYNFTSENEDSLHKYFALTNHYHCAYKKSDEKNKHHGIKSNDVMWYNCVNIVKKEAQLLSPDVIVIQGGWSVKKDALPDMKKYFSEAYKVTALNTKGLYKAENKTSGHICYVIGSYHPSFPSWHKEKYLGQLKACINEVRGILYGD